MGGFGWGNFVIVNVELFSGVVGCGLTDTKYVVVLLDSRGYFSHNDVALQKTGPEEHFSSTKVLDLLGERVSR